MKKVYLIQAEITSGPINEHYLPFSVGCIWAYANQFIDIQNNFLLADVIWKRDRQQDVLDKIKDPDIIGFSTYVWNHNWNLTLAKKIKQQWPNCLIVFGGPSINESWLTHDFIDVAMFGEGEMAWADLLRKYINKEPIERYWNNPRQQDITEFPSPYTSGFFDKIIKENPDVSWYMMIETNRGCPYHCTFCGWGADYLNKLKTFNLERTKEEMDWAVTNNIHWLFVIDPNAGILKERDVEIAWMARRAIEDPVSKIRRVTFNHAKNLNDACFEIEKIIQKWTYGLEMAVQSMNVPTLEASKRNNMGMNNLERAYALCQKHGIRYYTELVLGLPLETKETFINGLFTIMKLGQHDSVKTYPCTVIPNSEMASEAYQTRYGIKLIHPRDMYRSKEERIWDEEDHSWEDIAMVSATNTMSSQDMADTLSYHWMLAQFHYSGVTQLTSKYLYHMHNIEYRDFYDRLYQYLKQDILGKVLIDSVEEILTNYFTHGEVPNDERYHNVVALTLPETYKLNYIIENKKHFISLGFSVGESFREIEPSIVDLQTALMKDDSQTYPHKIYSIIDVDRWVYELSEYEIHKHDPVSHMQDQMYTKFLMKTNIVNINNPYQYQDVEDTYDGNKIAAHATIPIIPIVSTTADGRIL
jgi:radical SAM superfamily enzyme YgiQ (UPF0313 family)